MKNGRRQIDVTVDVIKCLLGALCVFFSYYAICFAVERLSGNVLPELSNAGSRIVAITCWLVLTVLASLIFRKNYSETYRIIEKKGKIQWALIPLGSALAFLFGMCINRMVTLLLNVLPLTDKVLTEAEESVSSVFEGEIVEGIIAVYILAPLCEELLFRGKMFWFLEKCFGGIASAIITSALFGVCHGSVIQMCYGFVIGLIFSFISKKMGSIIPAVFAHIGFNTSNVILYAMVNSVDQTLVNVIAGVLFVVLAVAIYLVGSLSDEEPEEEA